MNIAQIRESLDTRHQKTQHSKVKRWRTRSSPNKSRQNPVRKQFSIKHKILVIYSTKNTTKHKRVRIFMFFMSIVVCLVSLNIILRWCCWLFISQVFTVWYRKYIDNSEIRQSHIWLWQMDLTWSISSQVCLPLIIV
jgi:hypothetical protein